MLEDSAYGVVIPTLELHAKGFSVDKEKNFEPQKDNV
jgi:hypothetical protein